MADHDQRFKTLLQTFLPEFIALFFPDWVGRFDFTSVEWQPQEGFLDPPEGVRQVLDLVARVRVLQPVQPNAQSPASMVVLLHVEVESPEGIATFRGRMFDYYPVLRQRHNLPVLPIALYLRVGLEGIGWDVYVERFWERRVVQFEYPYIGLPALDAWQYAEGANLLGVALSALMGVPEEDKARLKARALQRLAESELDAARRYLLCECVETYLPLEGPHLEEYEKLLRTEEYGMALKVGKTSRELGRLEVVLTVLEERFGTLSAAVKARVENLSQEELNRLVKALLRAGSLRELGLDDEEARAQENANG